MLRAPHPDEIDASRPALNHYVRFVRILCQAAFAFAAVLVLLDLLLIGLAVVMRYVFTTAFPGADEIVAFSLTAIVMMAAPEILRQKRHIAVDILLGVLSTRARIWANLWAGLTVLMVALLLIVNGFDTVALSRMIGSLSDGHLEWPVWTLQLFLPLGGALLGLVSIEQMWRSLVALGDQTAEEANIKEGCGISDETPDKSPLPRS